MTTDYFNNSIEKTAKDYEKEIKNIKKQANKMLKEKDKEIDKKDKQITKLEEEVKKRLPPSETNRLKESRDNHKEKSKQKTKKIQDQNKELEKQRKEKENLEQKYDTLMRDIKNNFMKITNEKSYQFNPFPGENHIIFSRLYELIEKYPNKTYIKQSINHWVNHEIQECDENIKTLKKKIKIIEDINKQIENKNKEEVLKKLKDDEKNIYENQESTFRFLELEKDKRKKIVSWKNLNNNIPENLIKDLPKLQNKEYHKIKQEFYNKYDLITNTRNPYNFYSYLSNESEDKEQFIGLLTRQLEKQISLRKEIDSNELYFHDGDGKMVPYYSQSDINLQQIITENTIFRVNNKKTSKEIDSNFITSKTLYEKIPGMCYKRIHADTKIVAFENGFYNPYNEEWIQLNPQAPLLGYRQCQVNLYMDEDLTGKGGALEHIIKECFTEKDQKILLAYIGCCMYDPGYVKRQETLFLLGVGGIGKSTIIRSLLRIFLRFTMLQADKLNGDNRFCYSDFSENDIVMMEEIQTGTKEFTNKLKEITSGSPIEIEKKYVNKFSLPGEKVPRILIVGNNLPKNIYHEFAGAGALRRILILIPQKSFKDLGYTIKELEQQNCLEWLAQKATEQYLELELHKHDHEIGLITNEEKEERITLATFPEEVYLLKNFQISYTLDTNGNEVINKSKYIFADELFDFLKEQIEGDMLEITNGGNPYELSKSIKKAFDIPQYNFIHQDRRVVFPGLDPLSDEATTYFNYDDEVVMET